MLLDGSKRSKTLRLSAPWVLAKCHRKLYPIFYVLQFFPDDLSAFGSSMLCQSDKRPIWMSSKAAKVSLM